MLLQGTSPWKRTQTRRESRASKSMSHSKSFECCVCSGQGILLGRERCHVPCNSRSGDYCFRRKAGQEWPLRICEALRIWPAAAATVPE